MKVKFLDLRPGMIVKVSGRLFTGIDEPILVRVCVGPHSLADKYGAAPPTPDSTQGHLVDYRYSTACTVEPVAAEYKKILQEMGYRNLYITDIRHQELERDEVAELLYKDIKD